MGSSSSRGARRQRVAVIADQVAETQEHLESRRARRRSAPCCDALVALGFEPVVVEFAGDPASWLDALRDGRLRPRLQPLRRAGRAGLGGGASGRRRSSCSACP